MNSVAVNTTLDMSRLDLRRFANVVFNSSYPGPGYTVVVLTNAAGDQLRLIGTGFGNYDSNGVPHSGVVSQFDIINKSDNQQWINVGIAPTAVSDLLTAIGTLDNAHLLTYLFSGNDGINGNNGADILLGGDGDDMLGGGGGNDTLRGGNGADTFHGDAGVNTIYGEAGDDWMIAGVGTDRFDGGDGVDLVDFWRATNGVTIDLSKVTAQALGGGLGTLTVLHVENASGSDYGDMLIGGATANEFFGLVGDDTLKGMGGDDTLWGGDGKDLLDGGTGSDTLYGEDGDDHLIGGAGLNKLYGGNGADVLEGGVNNDLLDGGKGDDHAAGNGGSDSISGGDGDDTLDGGDGVDTLVGDAGNDTLIGGRNDDTLDGGAGADTMSGGLNNDMYWVDSLDDQVIELANEGRDAVHTRTNNYTLTANVEVLFMEEAAGVLTASGNELDNGLIGNSLDNVLYGLDGNDGLVGHDGVDILYGGKGNDSLSNDGTGLDTMYGGVGNDTYWINGSNYTIVEVAGEGTDLVYSTVSIAALADNVENLTLLRNTNINGTGNALNNIIIGNDGANVLTGGAGNDRMTGGAGADTFAVTQESIHSTVAKLKLEIDTVVDLKFADGDRIDLSSVDANINLAGDQSFTFVAAFDKHAGQATLTYVAASNVTQLKLDVDGDGKSDYQMNITGNMTDTHVVTGSEGGWLL